MKKYISTLLTVLLTCTFSLSTLFAQSPEKMSYQAVIRDASDNLITGTQVGMQISILQGSASGTAVYEETQTPTTNTNGLVTIEIGSGTVVSGDFTAINWSAGPYFIKTETDPAGGTSYTITGTSQLLSVPYALYAKTTDNIAGGINYNDIDNTPVTTHVDSSYIVELNKNDEDYINFGTLSGFTNNSSWSIIEQVKMPTGTGPDGGWHFFRGEAWQDKEGDIAIQIKSTQIYVWLQKSGWQSITYDHSFSEEQWYDICMQYNASTQTLELYVDGSLAGQQTGISPQDDSGNTNNLFWGGQDVDPSRSQGDLYAEASIVIANQVWLQRVLTAEEIEDYDGHIDSDPAIFFSSSINSNSVTDASGNGHDGTNGNTPEYIVQTQHSSEFNDPLYINDKIALTGNIQITGDINSYSSSGMTVVAPIGANGSGFGAALYVASDGMLKEADADAVTTMPCVALAVESGIGDKEVLLQGFIKNENWTWTPGAPIYVSPTTGAITQTKLSVSGQQVQIIGVAVSADMIYFTPNLMLIEIE